MKVLFVVEFDRCSAVVASETVVVASETIVGSFVVSGLMVEVVAFLPTIGLDVVSNLHCTC